jgi:hypothetical protein
VLVFVALLLAVLLVGCGDDDTTEAADTSTTTTEANDDGSTTSSSPVDGIDPLPGAGTEPVHIDAEGEGTALLTDVRVARHEGFDRVVFEFDGPLPEVDVEYVEPPISEDGSGDEIEVRGDAFLQVTMRPASGFDLSGEGEQTYDGPTRLVGEDAGTSVIQEVVRNGDFEAVLAWVIGISDRIDFRVDTLVDPSRVVVDVRNH